MVSAILHGSDHEFGNLVGLGIREGSFCRGVDHVVVAKQGGRTEALEIMLFRV